MRLCRSSPMPGSTSPSVPPPSLMTCDFFVDDAGVLRVHPYIDIPRSPMPASVNFSKLDEAMDDCIVKFVLAECRRTGYDID